MAKQKLTAKKFNISNPKILLPILFVVGFGLFGLYKVISSSAASANISVHYYNHARVSSTSSGVTEIHDDNSPLYSDMTVSQVSAGGKLVYDPIAPSFPVVRKICFVLRASSDQSAKVTIMGPNGARNLTLTPTSYYREFCAASNTLGQGYDASKPYNLINVSGGPVNVAMSTRYIDQSALSNY